MGQRKEMSHRAISVEPSASPRGSSEAGLTLNFNLAGVGGQATIPHVSQCLYAGHPAMG